MRCSRSVRLATSARSIRLPRSTHAPRGRQPALAAAICLLGVNCDSHEKFLVQTLDFTVTNPGFQDLVRSTRERPLEARGVLAATPPGTS